ncbi:hypothetical protein [Streptomyces sp. NPDC058426]|uniref:hypothetical protein n=1 Tax=unclassified Streptomyces TaxID=2593676 RepID=UPI0036654AB3
MKIPAIAVVVAALLACGACGTSDTDQAGSGISEALENYSARLDRVGEDCEERGDTMCEAFSVEAGKLLEYLLRAPDNDPRFHLSTLTPRGWAKTFCSQKDYDRNWKSLTCRSLVSKAAKFHIERLTDGVREVKVK